MNSEDIIKSQKNELLATYAGQDKVIQASEIWAKILEERKNRPPFTAKLGLAGFDECMPKLRRGHFVVLSGPPKNGKTALALTFTRNFVNQGLKCLWFPFEMGHEDILENFADLFSPNFDFYSPEQLADKEMEWVEARIIETKKKFGLDVVFIDNTDFLKDRKLIAKNVNMNFAAYMGGIIQGLKTIALREEIIIFLLHHINKAKWIKNDLPTTDDMSETRQIGQMPDYVLMIIRKRAEKKSQDIYIGNEAIAGVIENRHGGKTKKFELYMHKGFFTDDINFKLIDNRYEEKNYEPSF